MYVCTTDECNEHACIHLRTHRSTEVRTHTHTHTHKSTLYRNFLCLHWLLHLSNWWFFNKSYFHKFTTNLHNLTDIERVFTNQKSLDNHTENSDPIPLLLQCPHNDSFGFDQNHFCMKVLKLKCQPTSYASPWQSVISSFVLCLQAEPRRQLLDGKENKQVVFFLSAAMQSSAEPNTVLKLGAILHSSQKPAWNEDQHYQHYLRHEHI